jgi:hypothetical protein
MPFKCLLWIVATASVFCRAATLDELLRLRSADQWRGRLFERRCREEIALGQIPSSCYRMVNPRREMVDFFDRRCEQAVERARDPEILRKKAEDGALSGVCRKMMEKRGEILSYQMEEKSPLQSFEYLKGDSGPDFVNSSAHVRLSASQSD